MKHFLVALVFASGMVSVPLAQAGSVPICHVPPGNPGNTHVINVAPQAVPTHVAQHGDGVCASGDRDCCLVRAGGAVCTSLQSDESNCGRCGNACPAGDSCTGGTCVSPCPTGETDCDGTCTSTDTDPQNCGACGKPCATGDSCVGGVCIPPTITSSCLPASSLSVLIQGTSVNSYLPNGSWSEPATGVQLVPLEGGGPRATIATPNTTNSCSSNSATGQTVCTANNTDVYLITGSSLNTVLASGATNPQFFSGGSCFNCGVAIDSGTNQAAIALGVGGAGGYQFLDLATNAFGAPIPAGGQTSEDISVDPVRHLILSPNEQSLYQIMQTQPSTALFNNPFSPATNFDSAAEDCTTGIALASAEFTDSIFLADLTQATFVPGAPGSWSAPSQLQSLPEFGALTFGTNGIAVAPGSHLGVVTGEFGGQAFGVIQLPSTSGSGTPAVLDWAAANIPNDPSGAVWQMGFDPHPVTAYVSPNGGKATAVIANDQRTFLALVDLQALLAAARVAGTHNVDPSVDLVASGILTFVSVF